MSSHISPETWKEFVTKVESSDSSFTLILNFISILPFIILLLNVIIAVFNVINGDYLAAIAFFILGLVVAFIVYVLSFNDHVLAPLLLEKQLRKVKVSIYYILLFF